MNATQTTGPIGDRRRPPFCYQTHAALDAIREKLVGARRSTALAIYLSLTEAANRSGGAAARDGFRAQRRDLATAAGVSVDTFDRYVVDLERIGVLDVERQSVGRVNLPNIWTLVDPETGASAPPSRADAATLAAPTRPLARESSLGPKENPLEKDGESPAPGADLEVAAADVAALASTIPKSVDRVPVTPVEAALASGVLARWNLAAAQALRSRDWLAKIVMRIREYRELSLDDHDAIIRNALAHPWWSGPATPSVVYGSGAQFERCVVAWRTGNAGGRADSVSAEQIARHAEALRRQGQ